VVLGGASEFCDAGGDGVVKLVFVRDVWTNHAQHEATRKPCQERATPLRAREIAVSPRASDSVSYAVGRYFIRTQPWAGSDRETRSCAVRSPLE
jgi:hypothetical protein